jgi:hypothetical protein
MNTKKRKRENKMLFSLYFFCDDNHLLFCEVANHHSSYARSDGIHLFSPGKRPAAAAWRRIRTHNS